MVPNRTHYHLLRSHYLFEPMNDQQLDQLLLASHLRDLDKGEILFSQGERAEWFYFVISGTIKIYRLGNDGHEKVFAVAGDRETFAEAMMFMDTPNYVVCAQAVCPTQIYQLSNSMYTHLLSSNNQLSRALLANLSVRLHQRIEEIETLSLKNSTHRVVRYLLSQMSTDESGAWVVDLPVAKQLIAGQLSIQPETFSRIIRHLSDEKIIELHGRHIEVTDHLRLEQFE